MTTVIFVHGISVRDDRQKQKFLDEFEQIEKEFKKELKDELEKKELKEDVKKKLENIEIKCCFWGNALGAKLNAGGASIPLYDSTRSSNQSSQSDENIVRWMQLYQDPLYELRLLSLKPPKFYDFTAGEEVLKDKLDEKVRQFSPSNKLQDKLFEGGIAEVFDQARQNVFSSNPYREALETISDNLTEHRDAIARAIIAEAMAICEPENKSARILTYSVLRDEIVQNFSSEIIDSERGAEDWLKEQISKFAMSTTTYYLKPRRGVISDITYPAVGDILLYQARGQRIRNFIKSYIENAEPPVILLAHSLGGVACVDLLVQEKLQQVNLLVTVGSQAPYFYEIDALQSLEFGKTLPEHFPLWLNIYDEKDFLSYIGAGVFKNKVEDIRVDNQQPFPRSHGAYWTNSDTWKAIILKIKAL